MGGSDSRVQIDELTGVRGIAAWWVVFYHFRSFTEPYLPWQVTALFAEGYLAVDLFFMLSGFVLFLCHGQRFQTLKLSDCLSFYLKRLARVYPLHGLLLAAYISVPLSVLWFSDQAIVSDRYSFGALVANIFLVHSWGIFDQLTWNIPSWSISVEWFAYLCFPFVALAVTKVRDAPVVVALVIAGLLVAIPVVAQFLDWNSLGDSISRYGVIRGVLQFAIGCFLCPLVLMMKKRELRPGAIIMVIPVALLTAHAVGLVPDLFVAPLSFLVLIVYLAGGRGSVSKVCRHPALVFLGEISYSTYMMHYFVYDWFKFLIVSSDEPVHPLLLLAAFAVIFFGSVFVYKWVERPAQRYILSLGAGRRATI